MSTTEGITEIPKPAETETNSEPKPSALPPAPDTASNIRRRIQEKIDAGNNMSDKSIYPRIFKEIAEIEKCSYQNVLRIGREFMRKKKGDVSQIKTADKNNIIIETVSKDSRPPPKEKEVLPAGISKAGSKPILEPMDAEKTALLAEFDQTMIEMAFGNIAEFQRFLFGVSPSGKKLKRIAMVVSQFNQKMLSSGRPDQCIDISEKFLKPMLYMGIVATFVKPLAEKYLPKMDKKKDNKEGITEIKSMRG